MKILEDVVKHHSMGSHCTTTILKTLSKHAGYSFSEDMCLGLSSGLGFTYQKYTGLNYYFFTGRNEQLEENLMNILGGTIFTGTHDDADDAWETSKQWIDQGFPVVLEVDMMKLDYIRDKINLDMSFHFGLHTLLLVGYDQDHAYVLDYLWNQPLKISVDMLKQARGSKDAPVNPNNRWKVLQFENNSYFDKRQSIINALKINHHKYYYPYAFKMGLDGLKVFQKEVKLWFEKKDNTFLRENFYMMGVLFENVGTGGGNFRRMYARFLKEAKKNLCDNRIEELQKHYVSLFKLWRQLATLSLQFAEGAVTDKAALQTEINDCIHSIFEEEQLSLKMMRMIINDY